MCGDACRVPAQQWPLYRITAAAATHTGTHTGTHTELHTQPHTRTHSVGADGHGTLSPPSQASAFFYPPPSPGSFDFLYFSFFFALLLLLLLLLLSPATGRRSRSLFPLVASINNSPIQHLNQVFLLMEGAALASPRAQRRPASKSFPTRIGSVSAVSRHQSTLIVS